MLVFVVVALYGKVSEILISSHRGIGARLLFSHEVRCGLLRFANHFALLDIPQKMIVHLTLIQEEANEQKVVADERACYEWLW